MSEATGAWSQFDTVDALLAHPRAELVRLSPQQAYEWARTDSVIVDIPRLATRATARSPEH